MTYEVGPEKVQDGFTFADVRAVNGRHLGRIVKAEPSGTWRPDASLKGVIGRGVWHSYDEAKKALEEDE